MAGSLPNLHMTVPRWACIQGVLKVKVEFKGHVIWTVISQKLLLLPDKRDGSPSNLHKMVPTLVCIQHVLKVEVKIHVIWALVISQKTKSLLFPGKWRDCEQTYSFVNVPLSFSIPFSSATQSQMAVSLHCEFCHSSHCEAVCQTVCYAVRSHVLSLRTHTL